MKKFVSIILSIVCLLNANLFLTGCKEKELKLDTQYTYIDISFKKAKGIKLEDVSAFIPTVGVGSDVKSIKGFEQMLKDNIDKYSIDRLTENGRERIYLKTKLVSIRITEGYPYLENAYSIWLKYEGKDEEMRYGVLRDCNTFTCVDSNALIQEFYFAKGMLHYDLEFNDKFSVVYDYKINN